MIRLPSTIKLNNESFMCFFSFLFFAISDISRMFELIGIPRAVFYVLYLFVFASFFLKTMKQMKLFDYLYFLVVIPVVVWGTINYGSYIKAKSALYVMFIVFIPSYYFFRFCDLESMLKGLIASAYYSVIYLLLYYVFFVRSTDATYSMSYAYWIAPPMCVLFYQYMRKRRILDLLLAGLSFYTVISFGSRGALALSIAAIIYLYIFTVHDGERERPKIGWAIFFAVLIIALWNPILSFLSENMEDSRSIDKLLAGEFMESTSRDELYQLCQRLLANKPSGYGPLASRELMGVDPYPHSMYYEMQLDYGKVIGTVVFAFVIYVSVVNLWSFRKDKMQIIAATTCIIGIASLFVSSSYFQEMHVPAVIALYVSMAQRKRQQRKVARAMEEERQVKEILSSRKEER